MDTAARTLRNIAPTSASEANETTIGRIALMASKALFREVDPKGPLDDLGNGPGGSLLEEVVDFTDASLLRGGGAAYWSRLYERIWMNLMSAAGSSGQQRAAAGSRGEPS